MKPKSTVIHIVPRRAGTPCGVRDYAESISSHLTDSAIEHKVQALVDLEPARNDIGATSGPVSLTPSRDQPSRRDYDAPEGARVFVLHYSGYGYAPNGAPTYLPKTLTELCGAAPLVTFFHELYVPYGSIRPFPWTRILQQRVAKQLARISTCTLTNRQASREWLERQLPPDSRHVSVCGVPSSVGEPRNLPTWDERWTNAAIFGSRGTRLPIYRPATFRRLVRTLKELEVEQVHEIGAPIDGAAARWADAGLAYHSHGFIPESTVSRLLGSSRFGILEYHPDFLEKSSVFAAYCSHGVIPILRRGPKGTGEIQCPWVSSRSAQLEKTVPLDDEGFSEASHRCHRFYQSRSIAVTLQSWRKELAYIQEVAKIAGSEQ